MGDESKMPGNFDRLLGQLDGLNDVTRTSPTTTVVVPTLGVGGAETFIVQTIRQKDLGDMIFLQHVTMEGTVRIVIPPKVANVIARQRDQLTAKVRSKAAKAVAQERKDRGEVPAFLKSVKGGKTQ